MTTPSSRHNDIARFMEARRQGVETGHEMVYDPVTKKFVVRDANASADDLPTVTAQDMEAFGDHG